MTILLSLMFTSNSQTLMALGARRCDLGHTTEKKQRVSPRWTGAVDHNVFLAFRSDACRRNRLDTVLEFIDLTSYAAADRQRPLRME
jgi:hypothetical protein